MNSTLGRAILAGICIVTVLGWSLLIGAWLAWSVLIAALASVLAVAGLWWAMQHTSDAAAALREHAGRADQGSHHAFNGVRLHVEDDGRHVWIAGPGLQRALGRREPDEAQAARHTGAWRRNERGVLMLRVDAVVHQFGHMGGRDEPRVQKLRRYLERDVLYPAQRRRELAKTGRPDRPPPEGPA